ncbi:cadherin repeat domain-containing protein [Vibrio sinensis]|uniref:Cadherin repeat domain-containing protein n=1 Tax=Vibrio sinensis TaxID=2302434 RepID=A0A3A6QSA8_9VIBR|nr:cadherin repeat domain-containing protein [Vibrio sinensis]RJX75263.1 cadherin repeat domain-containing protein [Vibrio sinensis]
MKSKHLLALSIVFALVGCGNDSDDKPLPPVVTEPDNRPTIDGFENNSSINLNSEMVGLEGQELIDALTVELNKGLTARTGSFRILPKWGMGEESWDNLNFTVVQDGEDFVFKTTVDQSIFNMPSAENPNINNGFSFLIELPNGLVREAAMKYQVKWEHSFKQSPDYTFFGGFTSGDPLVENKPTVNGAGFTYKLNLDKYGYMNTRFADATDDGKQGKFFNTQLQMNDLGLRVDSAKWHQFQIDMITNNYVGNANTKDGAVNISYNGVPTTNTKGAVTDRTMIDFTHNYKLAALFEFYRHYKHTNDTSDQLKQQTIYVKDLVIAWSTDKVTLPDQTIPPVVEAEAPEVTPIGLITIEDYGHIDYQVVADDPNGLVMTFSIENAPSWVTIDTNTGLISLAPTGDVKLGLHSFNVKVANENLSTTVLAQVMLTEAGSVVPTPNACSDTGEKSRVLDLEKVKGLTGQGLIDAIAYQLNGAKNGSTHYDENRVNMAVVTLPDGELVLEVNFPQNVRGNSTPDNGTSFKLPFPAQDIAPTNACIAYDVMFKKSTATAANFDEIYVPNLIIAHGSRVFRTLQYTSNKYERMSANFGNAPHSHMGWLDNSSNTQFKAGSWYTTKQTVTADDTGKGYIDLMKKDAAESNNAFASYFNADPGKFDGKPMNEVQVQLSDVKAAEPMSFMANFDIYRRPTAGTGKEDQSFYFKNIAIGWN